MFVNRRIRHFAHEATPSTGPSRIALFARRFCQDVIIGQLHRVHGSSLGPHPETAQRHARVFRRLMSAQRNEEYQLPLLVEPPGAGAATSSARARLGEESDSMVSLRRMRVFVTLLGAHAALLTGCNKAAGPSDGTTPASEAPEPSEHGRCGGIAGIRCEKGKFCNLEPAAGGQGCDVADGMGVCTEVPRMCTYEYRPVCGCDGETYPTACVAHSKSVSVAHHGDCETADGGRQS
jgi:hypothetical protein